MLNFNGVTVLTLKSCIDQIISIWNSYPSEIISAVKIKNPQNGLYESALTMIKKASGRKNHDIYIIQGLWNLFTLFHTTTNKIDINQRQTTRFTKGPLTAYTDLLKNGRLGENHIYRIDIDAICLDKLSILFHLPENLSQEELTNKEFLKKTWSLYQNKKWNDVRQSLKSHSHFIYNSKLVGYTIKRRDIDFNYWLCTYHIQVNDTGVIYMESSSLHEYRGQSELFNNHQVLQAPNLIDIDNPTDCPKSMLLSVKGLRGKKSGKEEYIEGIITGFDENNSLFANIILLRRQTSSFTTEPKEYPFFSKEARSISNESILSYLQEVPANRIKTSKGSRHVQEKIDSEIPKKNTLSYPIKHKIYISCPITSRKDAIDDTRMAIKTFIAKIISKTNGEFKEDDFYCTLLDEKYVNGDEDFEDIFDYTHGVQNVKFSQFHIIILPETLLTGAFTEASWTFVFNSYGSRTQYLKKQIIIADASLDEIMPSFFNEQINKSSPVNFVYHKGLKKNIKLIYYKNIVDSVCKYLLKSK